MHLLLSSESLGGLGKIESYDISIVRIYLSHSIFGFRFARSCLQVSRPLPSLTGNLLPLFKVPWLLLKKITSYLVSSSFQALVLLHSLPSSWKVSLCCSLFLLSIFGGTVIVSLSSPSIYLKRSIVIIATYDTLFFKSPRYHNLYRHTYRSTVHVRRTLLFKYHRCCCSIQTLQTRCRCVSHF